MFIGKGSGKHKTLSESEDKYEHNYKADRLKTYLLNLRMSNIIIMNLYGFIIITITNGTKLKQFKKFFRICKLE